jgi:hypothetical protein
MRKDEIKSKNFFVVRNDDCIRETQKERFFHRLKKRTQLTVPFSIRLDHIFATRKIFASVPVREIPI